MLLEYWSNRTQLPKKISRIPRLSTPDELHFLAWFCQNKIAGKGEFVELGSWLGASTAAILEGLAKNQDATRPLRVYDSFQWHSTYYRISDLYDITVNGTLPELSDGQSFLPIVVQHLEPWAGKYVAYPGDINEQVWSGEPIELLCIDLMKSWETAAHVTQTFFPFLIPGLGRVYHQDFKHYATPWIHPIMYRLREYFEPEYSIQAGSAVVFKCIKSLDADICAHAVDFDTLTLSEIDSAFEYSAQFVGDAPYLLGEVYGAFVFFFLSRALTLPPKKKAYAFHLPNFRMGLRNYIEQFARESGFVQQKSDIVGEILGAENIYHGTTASHSRQIALTVPYKILLNALWLKLINRLKRYRKD